jgi:hypothetical protein
VRRTFDGFDAFVGLWGEVTVLQAGRLGIPPSLTEWLSEAHIAIESTLRTSLAQVVNTLGALEESLAPEEPLAGGAIDGVPRELLPVAYRVLWTRRVEAMLSRLEEKREEKKGVEAERGRGRAALGADSRRASAQPTKVAPASVNKQDSPPVLTLINVRRDHALHGISARCTDDGGHSSHRCSSSGSPCASAACRSCCARPTWRLGGPSCSAP